MTDLKRSRGSEEGAALILVLVFIGLFALLIPSILGLGNTTIRAAEQNTDQRAQQYASDSALRREIVRLRDVTQTCGSKTYSGAANTNSTDVTVTCKAGTGATTFADYPPNTMQALSPITGSTTKEGIQIDSNGNAQVDVYGDITSRGEISENAQGNSFDFIVHRGNVTAARCDGTIQVPDGSLNCTTPGPADPGYASALTVRPAAAVLPTTCPGAVTFLPGYYSAPPAAPAGCSSRALWFTPGNYYFDFTGATKTWDLSGTTVIGGTAYTPNFNPAAAVAAPTTLGHSCRTELDLSNNAGVQFLFGGNSQLVVGTGKLELCATPTPGSEAIAIFGSTATAATSTIGVDGTAAASVSTPAFATPTGAQVIGDGQTASVTMARNKTAILTMTLPAPAMPAGSILQSASMTFAHRESDNLSSLTLGVDPGGPTIGSYAIGTGLTSNQAALHTDTVDVTSLYTDTPVTTALQVTAVSTGVNGAKPEFLDGAHLDLTYYAPNGIRPTLGCLVVPLDSTTATPCNLITGGQNSAQVIHGTIYAPLNALNLGINTNVLYERAVIARSIELNVHNGNGSGAVGTALTGTRFVVLTASVGGVTTAKTVVAYRPSTVSGDNYEAILSWQELR